VAYAAPVPTTRVAVITLGCARNEVDSEELAGRFAGDGMVLVPDAEQADAVVVNTCGFIDAAKRESIEVLLAAVGESPSGRHRAVVAVGCMAERYGSELAAALPEADAVLGFDEYPEIAARVRSVLDGEHIASHVPRDRRELLPVSPALRPGSAAGHVPGHAPVTASLGAAASTRIAESPAWIRHRIGQGPVAALKIASGCDRRCAFCAIPAFRGAFVSRPATELVSEARWLVSTGVREIVLVSENSTSYGKDLGSPGALAALLDQLGELDELERIRVAYLQPAEIRPGLIEAMVANERVANHFDLSFQHASAGLLRRMRRFGGTDSFLELVGRIRSLAPQAGIRSNVIVGLPGETPADVDELLEFLSRAELDAVGVFGYSDEEGTAAVDMPGKHGEEEIRARVEEVTSLVDEMMAQRAEERIGQNVTVLVEAVSGIVCEGRAEHQGADDGSTVVHLTPQDREWVSPGSMLAGRVVASDGVDLHAVEVTDVRV
jgi:ribosomal protein S12 methylthiotransferase